MDEGTRKATWNRWLPLIVVLAVFALPLLAYVYRSETGMSDRELMDDLARHQQTYLQVVDLFARDSQLQSISADSVRPATAIGNERHREYSKLLATLDLSDGVIRIGSGTYFVASNRGMLSGGTRKGLAYKPDEPIPLFDSLDRVPNSLPPNAVGYRKVESDWYIFFEYGR